MRGGAWFSSDHARRSVASIPPSPTHRQPSAPRQCEMDTSTAVVETHAMKFGPRFTALVEPEKLVPKEPHAPARGRGNPITAEHDLGRSLERLVPAPLIEAGPSRREWLFTPPPVEVPEGMNRVNPSRLVHQVMPGEIAEVILTLGGLVAAEEGLGHLDAAGGQFALGQAKVRREGGPPGLPLADQEPIERRFQFGIGGVALIDGCGAGRCSGSARCSCPRAAARGGRSSRP